MAKGPLTPEGRANIGAGQRRYRERINDKVELADAVAEAVREQGYKAAGRVVREFARERPDSSVVRLMFPAPDEEEQPW